MKLTKSPAKMSILAAVADDGPFPSMTAVARHLDMNKSNVSRSLKALAEAGLVTMTTANTPLAPKTVEITLAGRAALVARSRREK